MRAWTAGHGPGTEEITGMAAAKKTPAKKARASTTGKGRADKVKADQTNWRTKLQQSRIKFDDDQKETYLLKYAEHGLKGRAAKEAGVCLQTVNNHIDNDPDFAAAVEAAQAEYRDKVVDHSTDLALNGIEVKKYNKDGDLIEERRDYPIRLIELELKRVEPGYRDKQTIDLNHGGGVMVAPPDMSPEDWIKQQEEKNASKTAPEGAEPSE